MSRVGLVMIVKNEAAVIRRALTSAIPFIDTWLIVDTGSTDATRTIVEHTLAGIPGTFVERPWVSFGANRTEALELCRGRMDWAIMLDADDTLEGAVPPRGLWDQTSIDGFLIKMCHDNVAHSRIQIFRVASNWIYEGVVHERAVCRNSTGPRIGILPPETYMKTSCTGSRSTDPDRFRKDAELLKAEVDRDPTNSRAWFYLAQSYRDAGLIDEAIDTYNQYLQMFGSGDNTNTNTDKNELYIAYTTLIDLVDVPTLTLSYAWSAIELFPNRLEAQYATLKKWHAKGWPPSQQLLALGLHTQNRTANPYDGFCIPDLYTWMFDEVLAAIAFEVGAVTAAKTAAKSAVFHAPPVESARILATMQEALRSIRTQ